MQISNQVNSPRNNSDIFDCCHVRSYSSMCTEINDCKPFDMNGNTTDCHLIELWRAGNEKAYRALFDKYFYKLYNYTLKLIADKNVSEEIVMDVMLAVWLKRDRLNTSLSLSAYLYRSVKNRLLHLLPIAVYCIKNWRVYIELH